MQSRRHRSHPFRALWFIGVSVSMIIGSLFTVIRFGGNGSHTSMYCLLRYLQFDPDGVPIVANTTDFPDLNSSQALFTFNTTGESTLATPAQVLPIEASFYWLGFVIFLYALPLTIIVILYGLMLKFLRGARGQSVGRSKRRATRMILAVVLTYAFCWFLMQLSFISNIILSQNTGHDFATYMDILTTFANVFAYLNSVRTHGRFARLLMSFSYLVHQSDPLRIHVEELSLVVHRPALLPLLETAPLPNERKHAQPTADGQLSQYSQFQISTE